MKQIEIKTLLDLHEKVNIPGLLANAEAWDMTKTDVSKMEKIELRSLKQMLGVPITTPTQAIMYVTGAMYMAMRINQKQLKYLHKLLTCDASRWTLQILNTLDRYKIRWATKIRQKLTQYEMNEDWEEIKALEKTSE
jgi:hypothetical protein